MSSFLMNCPQCGTMIAKDRRCPECLWSGQGEEAAMMDHASVAEFARRQQLHKRNYTIFMVLMFATGSVSLLTAVQWIRAIYLGDIIAFIWIALLTMLSAGLGVVLSMSKKLFPVDLNCPSCSLRLDEMGVIETHCPRCNVQLKQAAESAECLV